MTILHCVANNLCHKNNQLRLASETTLLPQLYHPLTWQQQSGTLKHLLKVNQAMQCIDEHSTEMVNSA